MLIWKRRHLVTLPTLLCLSLLLGCSSAPPSTLVVDFDQQPPAELQPLERMQWIAERVDKNASLPQGSDITMTYSTGMSHMLGGARPSDGKLEAPPADKIAHFDKQNRKHYHEFYHDGKGRLVAIASNVGGEKEFRHKLVYHNGRLLGSIDYKSEAPYRLKLLIYEGDRPSQVAAFNLEKEGEGWKTEQGQLRELTESDVDYYLKTVQ